MANKSVERDSPKLRFGFPPPSAPAAPHVKRYAPKGDHGNYLR